MLRGNVVNMEQQTGPTGTSAADGDDYQSDDDNVSLECADSGLGLHDPDRPRTDATALTAVHSPSTAFCRPVFTSTPADERRGVDDSQAPVY